MKSMFNSFLIIFIFFLFIKIKDKSTLHASEEERILRYNDEFEDMKYLGMLKYLIYPMKQGVKKISSVIFCCKKRKGRLAQQKENN